MVSVFKLTDYPRNTLYTPFRFDTSPEKFKQNGVADRTPKYIKELFKKDKTERDVYEIQLKVKIRCNPSAINDADDLYKINPNYAIKMLSTNGLTLEYMSDDIKSNKECVLTAIKSNNMSYNFVSDEIKFDIDVVLAALDDHRESEEQFILESIQNNIGYKNKHDESFIKNEQIKNTNRLNKYKLFDELPSELKSNPKILRIIITGSNDSAWDNGIPKHIQEKIKNDRELTLCLINVDPNYYANITNNYLKYNKEIILAAMSSASNRYISIDLPCHRCDHPNYCSSDDTSHLIDWDLEFVTNVVKNNPYSYIRLPYEYRCNPNITKLALKQNQTTYLEQYIGSELFNKINQIKQDIGTEYTTLDAINKLINN